MGINSEYRAQLQQTSSQEKEIDEFLFEQLLSSHCKKVLEKPNQKEGKKTKKLLKLNYTVTTTLAASKCGLWMTVLLFYIK